MRPIIAVLLFAFLIGVNVFAEVSTLFLINNCIFGWTLSKLTPPLLTLAGSIILGFQLFKIFGRSNKLKLIVSLAVPILFIIAFLIINKPYVEDYAKSGFEINNLNNEIISEHLHIYKNYNGLILVASSSCPHCMAAAEKLSILKKRTPNRNVDIYLFTTKQEVIEEFRTDTKSDNLNYHTVHNEEAALNLCDGRFPAFIYIKNGVPVKRWFNNDFGYPAYDWVEADLE